MTSSVWDWSTTAGSNTTVAGINIAEGCDPGNVNNAIRAVMAAAKGRSWGGTSGGTANAQTVTLTPAPAAYVDGMEVTFLAGFTNTSATTLNVNGLGAKDIFDGPSALAGGEIVINNIYTLVYDGVRFRPKVPTSHREFRATVADDAATSVAAPAQSGAAIIVISGSTHVDQSLIIVYRAASSPVITGQRIDGGGSSLGSFTTGILSGTTGTDGRLTVSAHTDGRIYFENRLGVSRNIAISFMAPVIA